MRNSYNPNINKSGNYYDPDLEKELNNISYHTYLSNNPGNNNSFLEYEKGINEDFDFTQFDKIFNNSINEKNTSEKNKPGKALTNLTGIKKITDEEIYRMLNESDKRINDEVEKEIRESFNPIENISEEDKNRAKVLIEADEEIKQLIDQGRINFEDIVLSIEYFELLSFVNKKKEFAVDSLKKISEIFKEDDGWKLLEYRLIQTINLTNCILENKLDYKSLLQFGKISEDEAFEFKTVERNDNLEEGGSSKMSSHQIAITNQDNKKEFYKTNNQTPLIYRKENEKISNIKDNKIKVKSENKITLNKGNKLVKSTTSLKLSTTSNISQISSMSFRSQNKKAPLELYDDQNKMTNLLKLRGERKEIIKFNRGNDLNSRPDLFKFNFNTNPSRILINSINKDDKSDNTENEEEIQNQKFMQLLEMPKIFAPDKGEKKNLIRKRIEDAVNFYKNKFK
jgi:hypothetical protein